MYTAEKMLRSEGNHLLLQAAAAEEGIEGSAADPGESTADVNNRLLNCSSI